jgi:D-xylose transport system substrate-binding protein
VDVLVIIPHNGAAMAKAVRMAHAADIPVIAYDRLITDCELDLYITFDNVKVGEMQARFVADHLPTPGEGRVVRIHGAKTDNNAFLFKEGQDLVMNPLIQAGKIEVIHEDWADNWSPARAKQITNAAITRHGTDFDAILVTNDGCAGGAIQALKEEGLAGKVLVTGQDADRVACQRIAAGTQSMTIYKPIRNLATRAAEVAVALARGKPVIARHATHNKKIDVPSILLEVISVTRDNLEETVIADGFHSREDVFTDTPAASDQEKE